MVSIMPMKLEDSHKIREIDRSETIHLIYTCKDGVLEEIPAGHECPNWSEDAYQEIISRYEYELSNGGTAFGAFDGDRLVGFGVLAHKFRGEGTEPASVGPDVCDTGLSKTRHWPPHFGRPASSGEGKRGEIPVHLVDGNGVGGEVLSKLRFHDHLGNR